MTSSTAYRTSVLSLPNALVAHPVGTISRNTINLWYQRKAKTGDVKAKSKPTTQALGKITDWEQFRAFVKVHKDKTQAEMAHLWERDFAAHHLSSFAEDWTHS